MSLDQTKMTEKSMTNVSSQLEPAMSLSLYRVPEGNDEAVMTKGHGFGPAHTYTHLLPRSGRSRALPYSPKRQRELYHNSGLLKQFLEPRRAFSHYEHQLPSNPKLLHDQKVP